MADAGQPVARRIRWQVWGAVILLSALVLAVGFGWWFTAWYVQANDSRWCSYFATMTRVIPAGDTVIYAELRTAQAQAGC